MPGRRADTRSHLLGPALGAHHHHAWLGEAQGEQGLLLLPPFLLNASESCPGLLDPSSFGAPGDTAVLPLLASVHACLPRLTELVVLGSLPCLVPATLGRAEGDGEGLSLARAAGHGGH